MKIISGHLLHAARLGGCQISERHQRRVPRTREPRRRLLQPGQLQRGFDLAPIPTRPRHEVQGNASGGFGSYKVNYNSYKFRVYY